MKSRFYYPPLEAMRLWGLYVSRMTELMLASTQVVAYRSRLMAASGGARSVSERRELARMAPEKVAAAGEALQAIASRSMALWPQLGFIACRQGLAAMTAFTSLATGTPAQAPARWWKISSDAWLASAGDMNRVSASAARIATHGLKPIGTRARANARRLAKRRT